MKTLKEKLIELCACKDALEWAAGKTWKEVYETCHRGDWLLWLFKRSNPDDFQRLTLAKGHCAATVLHLMKDERSINAVKVAIAFGEGKATRKELDSAYAAACAASYTASTAFAIAAYAAAAYAADAAAYAAYAAARTKNQQEIADICRKYLPFDIWNISNELI